MSNNNNCNDAIFRLSSNTFRLTATWRFIGTTCILLCLFFSSAEGGEWMGFLKREIGYPFSGFEGQLLYKGEPAAGAEITRTYDLFGDKGQELLVADDQGKFKFDSIVLKFRTPLLAPVEFLSYQEIYVNYRGEQYRIWGGAKRVNKEYSEFNGRPDNLRCELTEEPRRVDLVGRGFIGTSCHWENKL
ncbi:MAG: hypothetical protein P8176_04985 [Gammaproteobacteria bacterium]